MSNSFFSVRFRRRDNNDEEISFSKMNVDLFLAISEKALKGNLYYLGKITGKLILKAAIYVGKLAKR